ncbi:MAG: hypothetical protein ACRBDL_00605 [Alphaproteobacteria bacterium]
MSIVIRNISSFLLLSGALLASSVSFAQGYHGSYTPTSPQKEYDDLVQRPIPRIFSSRINEEKQGQVLDSLYNDLFVSLWLYAGTDINYQSRLYDLVMPEKFQLTRYSKEFKGDMNESMNNLNQNFKRMMDDIAHTQLQYEDILAELSQEDQDILAPLWDKKIEEFRSDAEHYFKLQGKFLKIYHALVTFILKQGGSYYYDSTTQKVTFYKFGGYKYYGQSIDNLRQISHKQKILLKENTPANPAAPLEE